MKRLMMWMVLPVLLLPACSKESKPTVGNTPEEVIMRYQSLIDKNRFEEAQKLSTPEEQERLGEIAAVLTEEETAAALMTTRILNMECQTGDNLAVCLCRFQDDYEEYSAEFRLVKIKGQWLIDAPDGAGSEREIVEKTLQGMQ